MSLLKIQVHLATMSLIEEVCASRGMCILFLSIGEMKENS